MASGWMKSLQCKSRAYEDVYHPNSKNLIPSSSCRKSVQNIKDVVVDTTKPRPKSKPKPRPEKPLQKHPSSRYPPSAAKPDFETTINRSRSVTATATRHADPRFPSLTELTEGHPSRNVVEIIFHTSWGPKPFSGRVEMIFKVHSGPRTVSRFEEYRETVKGRAGSGTGPAHDYEENARCVADGNEVMRFHCLGPTSSGGPYGGACALSFPGGKGSAICTFAGSGDAHESSGGGRGRRAMLVCRVVAGRVSKQNGFMESLLDGRVGFDSVSGDNGELLVFDSRAVLPCFLIIYKL
ncbi:uncharacterized protein LOC114172989 [Vigna unguiculata]|uniref:PolyADP-ribose polymerase n=1 Tax=Vigna unguiculata TaxID=3917 RepID=A0A4D6LU61_VIGUN|nr:uncharacterized protein LOC114172989 [Vigna unguiculata]QCD91576.1 PolyADP-ribose polymerase [Vigna unguiculata]